MSTVNAHMQHTDSGARDAELAKLGLPEEMIAALTPAIAAARRVDYAPGDTLYHEGTEIEALLVIHRGRVKLVNYLENGRARIVRLHNRGAVIGLNGLMDEAHAHTAVAIDAVSLYHLPMHLIKPVKDDDPEAYCRLLEYWHAYLNTADTWITEFSTGTIRGRVARLIRFLIENDDETGPSEVSLLTVEEMADILGVTPESVSRVMAELKRRKILRPESDESPNHYHCVMKKLLKETEK